MDTPRAVLLIIILIILFVFPDSPRTSSQSQQSDLDRQLSYERQAIKILDRTIYGSFSPVENRWINLTGLREEDSYAWDLLPSVHARAKEQIKTLTDGASIKTSSHYPAGSTIIKSNDGKAQNYPENKSDIWGPHHSVYQNVTGTVRGHWTRSRCAEGHSPPTMNLTTLTPYINYSNQKYSRNVTGSGGNLQIKLGEKDGELLESEAGSVQEIRAEMTIKDPGSSGDGWQMTLHGIHYPRQGGIVLSTTSQR